MPEGTFNVSEWATRMGLRNLRELPFSGLVQPVVSLGDLGGLLPQYRPPVALYGQFIPAVVGQGATCEITAMAPGGTILEAAWFSGTGSVKAQVFGAPALGAPAAPVALLSNIAPESVVRFGTSVPAGAAALVMSALLLHVNALLWYIRPGDTLRLINTTVNSNAELSVVVRDVPVTEPGPTG